MASSGRATGLGGVTTIWAIGALGSRTVIVTEADALPPLAPVTVSVKVWEPTPRVTVRVAPLAGPDVVLVQLYVRLSPGSPEPMPLSVTEVVGASWGSVTVYGVPPTFDDCGIVMLAFSGSCP